MLADSAWDWNWFAVGRAFGDAGSDGRTTPELWIALFLFDMARRSAESGELGPICLVGRFRWG